MLQKLPLHSVQFIRPPLPSSLLISFYSGKNVCKPSLVPVKLKSCFLFLLHECFFLMKISLIEKMDPTCLSQQFCLIVQFIHGCSTAACLISSFLFSWLLPKHLEAARFAIFSFYSQKIAASPLHSHTLLHIPLRERRRWLYDFPFCSPSPGFAQEHRGVLLSVQQLSLVHLGKKLIVTCTSSSPVSFISWSGGLPHAAVLSVLLCLYTKGHSGRISLHHRGSCPCRVPLLLCCSLRI